MQKYELAIVLDAKASAAKKKKVTAAVEKIVSTFKGKVGKIEDWGKKDAGIYLFFPLELETSGASELGAKLKVENDIIKYLLVRKG